MRLDGVQSGKMVLRAGVNALTAIFVVGVLAGLADRHGLDQAQDEAPRDAVFGHCLDLVVGGVGQRDHVDLDLPEDLEMVRKIEGMKL